MTTEELDHAERAAFLQWRRQLAELENNEKLVLTPFEKNIEVWKQLWRVIERSDLIIQVLDSRDPLLFRSVDMEKYVNEFPEHKLNLLLMNKADLLSEKQRQHWLEYFKKQNIRVLFFSAKLEQEKIDKMIAEMNAKEEEEEEEDIDYDKDFLDSGSDEEVEIEDEEENEEHIKENEEHIKKNEEHIKENEEIIKDDSEKGPTEEDLNDSLPEDSNASNPTSDDDAPKPPVDISLDAMSTRIIDRHELFEYCVALCKANPHHTKDTYVFGMAGYPNVGKSSTVNVLVQKKRVAVSATPGKTKHFQTLIIDEKITLCDCPGLVFPTFVSTKAEMLCSGLMRVAEMRECVGPTSIVVRRIPRKVLEVVYNVDLSQKSIPYNEFMDLNPYSRQQPRKIPLAIHLLQAYAKSRGFFSRSKKPDEFRAAKIILNDYIDGKILFCKAPPEVDQKTFDKYTVQRAFLNKINKTG